jgi:hypothetical protein
MDENSAIKLAHVLGADTWNAGNGMWLVVKKRSDGKVLVFSNEIVRVFADAEAVQSGIPEESIAIV